jgi:hypothetical protein
MAKVNFEISCKKMGPWAGPEKHHLEQGSPDRRQRCSGSAAGPLMSYSLGIATLTLIKRDTVMTVI